MNPLKEAPEEQDQGLWSRMLSCASLEDIQHDILAPLCCLLDAESGVYIPYRIDHDVLGEGICCGVNADSLVAYKQNQFHKVDPVTSACKEIARTHFDATTSRLAPYPITQLCELMDPKVFKKTEYYNDFLKRFDIQEVLAAAIPLQSLYREVLVIGFHRPLGAKPFSLANIESLRSQLPALRAGITNYALNIGMAEAMLVCNPPSTESGGAGVVVLNDKAEFLFANDQAMAELGLREEGKTTHLIKACEFVLKDLKEGDRAHFRVPGVNGISVDLDMNKRLLPDSQLRLVITTKSSNVQEHLSDRFRVFDLSPRESEVARYIVMGLNNESIGMQTSISVRTVENHLRSIYAKIGINSRTQLVARLLDLK